MIGETLSHYRVIAKIGSGGMGVVFRAHDEQLDRDVALKVLPAGTLTDEAARKRFRKEALALAKFNHPNIATVHEFNSEAGVDFLAMELIDGKSLRDILKNGPVPESEIQRLGAQLTDGLAAAHEHGVIHRDLKPANIMITPTGRLKILDFGLAKLAETAGTEITLSSSENQGAPGTLPYMAPEQLHGEPADPRTDVYGAGAVLYEMATGRRPFPEAQAPHLMNSILHRPPQPPRELNPQLSPGMQAAILKTLEKDPGERYQSARELLSELEKLGSGAAAPTISPPLESQAPPLEIAHVLFMDMVAYSMMPMDQQRHRLRELQKIVQSTSEFSRAKATDQLISLATGDGMALVFFGDSEAPVRCALELSRALRDHPAIQLRMGLHTGPVFRVADVNANRNVAGGGINTAQRVMDCGDAGHILVSKAMVDVLGQLTCWDCSLHDLGEAEVKHGVRIQVFNLVTDEVGNPTRPSRMHAARIKGNLLAPTVKKSRPAKSGSGPLQRRKSAPVANARSEAAPNSSGTHTVQIVLPQATWRTWVLGSTILLTLLGVSFAIPSIRSRVFGVTTENVSPPEGVPSPQDGKYLAVLPFAVQGDRNTLGYVAEGFNEELSRKLLVLSETRVVSAKVAESAAKTLKVDLEGSTEVIARNLGANLIVRGNVQSSFGQIHVSVSLEDVWNRRTLWRHRFSEVVTHLNLLTLEDQAYGQILKHLGLKPSGGDQGPATVPTQNSEAYELYARGLEALHHHTDVLGIDTAIGFFEQATKLDPRFGLAYSGLADASREMRLATEDSSWAPKALDAARQGQRLNDNLPDVHLALGKAYREVRETEKAIAEFERALQLSPNCEDCWHHLGLVYQDAGRRGEALDAFGKALLINQFSVYNQNAMGVAYMSGGEYDKALKYFREMVKVAPDSYLGHLNLGEAYYYENEYQEAISELERSLQLMALEAPPHSEFANDDEVAVACTALGACYFYTNRYADAVKMYEKAVERQPSAEWIVGNLADGYRWSGQVKKASDSYERAISLAKTVLAKRPNDAVTLGDLALYYAKTGRRAPAEDCAHKARSIDPSSPELIYDEAVVRVLADQPTKALESLRLAFKRNHYLARQATTEPEFKALRGNPEFETLVREYLGRSD